MVYLFAEVIVLNSDSGGWWVGGGGGLKRNWLCSAWCYRSHSNEALCEWKL